MLYPIENYEEIISPRSLIHDDCNDKLDILPISEENIFRHGGTPKFLALHTNGLVLVYDFEKVVDLYDTIPFKILYKKRHLENISSRLYILVVYDRHGH